MLTFLKNKNIELYVLGLILMAISMPLSNFGMSVSQFVMAAAWLLTGLYKQRTIKLISNKPLLVFWSLFILHIVGCTYSTDMDYALKDIRTKLPLFTFPLVVCSMPSLSKIQLHRVLLFFVSGVIFSSVIAVLVWLQIIPINIRDTRDISIFVSHIRLSLMVVMAIFILYYFAVNTHRVWQKLLIIATSMFLIIFLFILESLTGLFIFAIVILVCILHYFITQKKYVFVASIVLAIMLIATAGVVHFNSLVTKINDCTPGPIPAESTTVNGNPYTHVVDYKGCENGHFLGWYICINELRDAWNNRANIKFDSLDNKKQMLSLTLVRYLSSKGLRKDSAGVYALSTTDISAIEKGVVNYKHLNMNGLQLRLEQLAYEMNNYYKTGNASGFSLAQRIEYNKASIHIIKNNLLLGVGTGDNKLVFDNYYTTSHSLLAPQWRLRSHNQYLAIGVSFGLVGIIVFVIALLFPFFCHALANKFLATAFLLIALLSFINEDTLETQAGVSFFVFFYTLLILHALPPRINTQTIP